MLFSVIVVVVVDASCVVFRTGKASFALALLSLRELCRVAEEWPGNKLDPLKDGTRFRGNLSIGFVVCVTVALPDVAVVKVIPLLEIAAKADEPHIALSKEGEEIVIY